MSRFKYRLLWTYAEWITGGHPRRFVANYKQLIDFMSRCGLNGLIVWGLLDDDLGGAGPAREICRYANAKGVRILPGVGLGSYGGIWFHGRNRYNVESYLAAHPERTAVLAKGTPFDVPLPRGVPRGVVCTTQEANLRWLEDGVRWLCRHFPIGGVNFEVGDNGLCVCPACLRRSKETKNARRHISFADMGMFLRHFSRQAHSQDPRLWLTNGIYTDYWSPPVSAVKQLRGLPRYAATSWNVAGFGQAYRPRRRIRRLFRHENLGYARYNGSTHAHRLYSPVYPNYSRWGVFPFLASIRNFCRVATREQLEGIILTGSGLPSTPDNELNYLAFGWFAQHPEKSVADFTDAILAPIYGGEAARLLVKVLLEVEKINPQIDNYLYWIVFPLVGTATGGWLRKSWGLLVKVDRKARSLREDWKNCGRVLEHAVQALPKVEARAIPSARMRLRQIATCLEGERWLFQNFFPHCLPVFREYRRVVKAQNLRQCEAHYRKVRKLADLLADSPLDHRLFSPDRMLRKYRKQLNLGSLHNPRR